MSDQSSPTERTLVRELLRVEWELDRIFAAGLPNATGERWSYLTRRAYALHRSWTAMRAKSRKPLLPSCSAGFVRQR